MRSHKYAIIIDMRPDIKLQAVILTGSRDVHNPLLAGTNLISKVMLPVGGKPMVQSVLETVAASKYAPEIFVSTNDPDIKRLQARIPFTALPSEQRAVDSFMKSLARLPEPGYVLFVSADHPLLTTEMVDYFIDEMLARKLGMGAAVVNRTLVQQHYPLSRRSYFPVKGGAYSGGNMYLINAREFNPNPEFLADMDRNRKAQWKNVRWLDPITMAGFLLRLLDIHQITSRASRLMGCSTGVVDMPFAECCMDVDKPSDKEIAEEILRKRNPAVFPSSSSVLPQAAAN